MGSASIIRLAEEALGRAARDLAVVNSALGGAVGEAYDSAERCCDRLLLVDLLLERLRAADNSNERLRAADALEKAMGLAEDCASLVRRARQDASGTTAT